MSHSQLAITETSRSSIVTLTMQQTDSLVRLCQMQPQRTNKSLVSCDLWLWTKFWSYCDLLTCINVCLAVENFSCRKHVLLPVHSHLFSTTTTDNAPSSPQPEHRTIGTSPMPTQYTTIDGMNDEKRSAFGWIGNFCKKILFGSNKNGETSHRESTVHTNNEKKVRYVCMCLPFWYILRHFLWGCLDVWWTVHEWP